jgi:hypothetical protein
VGAVSVKDALLAIGAIAVLAVVTVTVVLVLRYERKPHHLKPASQVNLEHCLQNLGNGGC